jgi:hypothetical protein
MWSVRGMGVALRGEHVHGQAQLQELLLVLHAEALLLIDDHQAQIIEPDILRQEPVRADDHVDMALPERVERLVGLLAALEA